MDVEARQYERQILLLPTIRDVLFDLFVERLADRIEIVRPRNACDAVEARKARQDVERHAL